jgi:putative phosphoesterase
MKIAVFSDIHDNIWNLAVALKQVAGSGAEALLFLGDLCAPFTLTQMAQGFPGPIHVVAGNNEGDGLHLARIACDHDHVHLHGQMAELEIGGRRIALNHYPHIARRLAESGAYDAVFSGHDHKRYVHRIGNTLWANPGDLMGRFGQPGFGLYDPAGGEFSHVDLAR